MSLSSEYRRQRAWRPWPKIFGELPPLPGSTILDLGCGPGDQAAELVARGARVIGIDLNEELLREARNQGLRDAEFRLADLRTLRESGLEADGIWSSFAAAYFTDFPFVLAGWASHLRPGGWMAITEIDDLFGHQPLGERTKALLDGNARDALAAGRYDFHMGRKLRGYLEQSGFAVAKVLVLQDEELSFSGAARPEVVDAWRRRFDRMKALQDFCGAEYERVREEFLGCLGRADHRSQAKVICCIASKMP
jgi:SAM-dependent methyltransferase